MRYQKHAHEIARKLRGPVKTQDHLPTSTPVQRFNTRFAVVITAAVGTMWCAYAFALLALVSLPSTFSTHNIVLIVAWIAQTFLQLVLLSVIIVGQQIQSKASDERSEQTYKDAEMVLHEARQIQTHLGEQDTRLNGIVARLNEQTRGKLHPEITL